jgi:2-iminobutanoate/2-iminopropanoate deaminase
MHPMLPLSPAVHGTAQLYVSGHVGDDPGTGKLFDGGTAAELRQALANVTAVLAANGRGLGDVLKVNLYLVDMADFAVVNEVYRQYFQAPYPARTTVAVAALPLGARIEVELACR